MSDVQLLLDECVRDLMFLCVLQKCLAPENNPKMAQIQPLEKCRTPDTKTWIYSERVNTTSLRAHFHVPAKSAKIIR